MPIHVVVAVVVVVVIVVKLVVYRCGVLEMLFPLRLYGARCVRACMSVTERVDNVRVLVLHLLFA